MRAAGRAVRQRVDDPRAARRSPPRASAPTADGWYGSGTTSSYATWQRRLGYAGIDANGLPGKGSLTTLGSNRFTVTHPVTLGSRNDTYGGKRVNTRTRLMLAAADARVPFAIRLTQGSYNPGGVGASAGTHDGGGVVDVDGRPASPPPSAGSW